MVSANVNKKTSNTRHSEENYAWNPECLKYCDCRKSIADYLRCDGIEDTPESAVINLSEGINYLLINVAPFALVLLLFLVVMAFKYSIE